MSFPSVAEAFDDWDDAVELKVSRKVNVDGEIVEQDVFDTTIRGVLQPLPQRELLVKPEGQRQWDWRLFYTEQELKLDTILVDDSGKEYRVRSASDWGAADFFVYQLTQGPTQ